MRPCRARGPRPARARAPAAAAAFLLVPWLASCATTSAQEVYDPFEPVNRAIFRFNDVVDRAVLEPAARAYRHVTPRPVRAGVRNFLLNLRSPVVLANDLLQGEPERAGTTLARFMINSSPLGFFGLRDTAAELGHEPHYEDFGQTLGVWGLDAGPYLMLPILGPSSARDAAGLVGDYALDPLSQCCIGTEERLTRFATGSLSDREQALEVVDDLRRNSFDMYATVRSAYAQRRAALIRNGAPPSEDTAYDDIFKDPDDQGAE